MPTPLLQEASSASAMSLSSMAAVTHKKRHRKHVFKYNLPRSITLQAFYNNRGQGVASIGAVNKDGAMMEFLPASKAYQEVPWVGFRTFVRGTRGDKTWVHEPFFPEVRTYFDVILQPLSSRADDDTFCCFRGFPVHASTGMSSMEWVSFHQPFFVEFELSSSYRRLARHRITAKSLSCNFGRG